MASGESVAIAGARNIGRRRTINRRRPMSGIVCACVLSLQRNDDSIVYAREVRRDTSSVM